MIKQTYLTIFILLGVWLTSCQDEDNRGILPPVIDGNKVEVTIATNVPALTVQTRADATADENKLASVDILVFEKDGENEVFAYRTKNTNDLSEFEEGDDIYVKTKLTLSEDGEKYRIVLLANLRSELDALFGNDDFKFAGDQKEVVLEKIKFEQTGTWSAADEPFRALPMWGQNAAAVEITSTTNFEAINLIRGVARIELGVYIQNNEMSNQKNLFDIQEVKVYNVRKQGYAVPDPDNVDVTKKEVTAPTLVSGSGVIESLAYGGSYIDDNQLASIYVNEALNVEGDGSKASNALYLIVKAIYRGDDANNETATYYKIDFYDDSNTLVNILRNFDYNMRIIEVKGPGSDSEEGANSNNLTTALTGWSNGNMKYVVFSGQYYLAVSESSMSVPKAEDTHSFLVRTNYPGGWSAEAKAKEEGDDISWLHALDPGSSSQLDQDIPLSFKVNENDGGGVRKGVIGISCGSQLTLDVHVEQTVEEGISLKIQVYDEATGQYVDMESNTLLFHSGNHYAIEPRKLRVTWTPASENLIVDFDRSFDWGDSNDLRTIYENGTADLTIVPARMLNRPLQALADEPVQFENWFPSEKTEIDIQVGGNSTTKQIISVKKQHYEIYIDRAERYKLDGKTHSFKIYSNSPSWEISFVDKGGIGHLINGGVNPRITGGYNLVSEISDSGETIEFHLAEPANESINAEIIIQVEYSDLGKPIIKEYVFRAYYEDTNSEYIAGGDANCYVLQPNGKKIHIPVSQANRSELMGIQLGANDSFDYTFIWTDHPNGFNKEGDKKCPVVDINIIGTGSTAVLEVTPGSEAGNAVIGITKDGKILWSWHLWVSDFDPNNKEGDRYGGFRNYEFLDRNLGALTDDPTDPKSVGLYYQWGRKDPFPSATAAGSKTFIPIYKADGSNATMTSSVRGQSWDGNGAQFLEESIREPLNFIKSTEFWFTSDFTNFGEYGDKFWSENETNDIANATKGVFDPCPDGWKTVPGTTSAASEWYTLFKYSTYYSNGHYSWVYNTDFIDLGYWPHASYIEGGSATISNTDDGRYWTANMPWKASNQGVHFKFYTNSSAHPGESLAASNGLTVRCMRRVDERR